MVTILDNFITYLEKEKKSSSNTVLSYHNDLTQFVDYLNNSNMDLGKLKNDDIKQYISHLKDSGKSNSTVTRNVSALRCFFNYLCLNDIFTVNIAKNIELEKSEKKLPEILTNDEVDLILKQPHSNDLKGIRDRAMLEILYATGIRVSELINLDIDDVDLNIGFVKCNSGSKERIMPVYPSAIKSLENYIKKARNILVGSPKEKALFVNISGKRMTRQGFWKMVKYYANKAGIKKIITPHTLRHSFTAHLLENGADIKSIQEMLGHSDISTTQVYAQLIKNKKYMDVYKKCHPKAIK